ncbi:MAG: hypothetical protein DRJ31_06420 [Candidatus Methanomethylicota archaeon]|uniref:Uncharacterized protein n=1 Tax=Thermoproteota archaeon TaxID=2056631 RepID=A0A497EN90_9CREN|nr:MAG: hypothetical protein DRJ31_06420 [Candidatus Verstraetearchaeota archaeon]RLE49248.1 MAG: hypothetical protein DRJ33_08445 [Candidatus Verstraetearchaeota archaeon]
MCSDKRAKVGRKALYPIISIVILLVITLASSTALYSFYLSYISEKEATAEQYPAILSISGLSTMKRFPLHPLR